MQQISIQDIVLPTSLTEVSESFDAWVSRGRSLCDAGKRLQWEMGDWWRSGQHAYGSRAKIAAQGIFGVEYKTLKTVATVAGSFERSRRRDLSFSHHAEVAALPPKVADELLGRAERDGLSTRDLRAEVVKQKEATVKETKPVSKIMPRPVPPKAMPASTPQAAKPANDDHDDPITLSEIVDELQAENTRLIALLKTAEADDLVAEAVKWRSAYERSQAAVSEAMDSAASSQKREKFSMAQLRRCGKAVGVEDPRKIAAAVEAMAKGAVPCK